MKNFLKLNNNVNTTHKDLWDITWIVCRGTFTLLRTCIRKKFYVTWLHLKHYLAKILMEWESNLKSKNKDRKD